MPRFHQRLAIALVLSALTELLLLRTLMRTGPFLPMAEQLGSLYRGMQLLGTAAANVTIVLAIALIVITAARFLNEPGVIRPIAAALAIVSASLEIWLTVAPSGDPRIALGVLTMAALAVSTALLVRAVAGPGRLPALVIMAAYLSVSYHLVAQPARALGIELPESLNAYFLAEALAVVAAAGAFLLVKAPLRRAPVIIAAATGSLILILGSLNSWAFGIAMMWNFSFSMYLPVPMYAAGAAIYAYTLTSLWADGDNARAVACGLLLIGVGGLKLDAGYSALLALAGCYLVASQTAQLKQRTPSAEVAVLNSEPNSQEENKWLLASPSS